MFSWWTRSVAAVVLLFVLAPLPGQTAHADDRVVYEGREGPGKGKHIVFVAGCWEYRPEEALPMLAKILAVRHGFKCTVVFPIDPKDGTINPNVDDNIPALKVLKTADMMVTEMMMLELPDEQMKHIADFVDTGKPIMGLRCSVLAFYFRKNKNSAYAKYRVDSKQWPGGFGQQVLGTTWQGHHGRHGHESTRGIIKQTHPEHPVLRGVKDIWGPTDVYRVNKLPSDAKVLVEARVLKGMKPDDKPNLDKPVMPMIWTREFTGSSGKKTRVVTSTIAAAPDFESEGLRRIVVNGCYWALGLENQIPKKANVDYIGEYHPSFFGRNRFKKGLKPEDLKLTESQ